MPTRRRTISAQTLSIARAMLDDPTADWYGLQLSKASGLPTGTIYPALARMESYGWIERRDEDIDPKTAGRPARKLYRFSEGGAHAARVALTEHIARLSPPDAETPTAPAPRPTPRSAGA